VVTAKVVEREVVSGHTFVGTAMPKRVSEVGSAVDGRVVELPITLHEGTKEEVEILAVNLGDRVEKGQPIAQLLRTQLEIELAGANAELKNREAALQEAQRGRAEEIEQGRARLAGKEAAREFAVRRLDRYKKATNKQIYTQEQVEEIYSAAVQADKARDEAKIALDLLVKGAREEVLEQWRAKLEVQRQEIERIKDQLNKHTIRAPFAGYIVAEHTEAGQWVTKGDLIATVAELDEIDFEIQVLENYIANVKVGDQVRLEITSLPNANLVGQVAEIVPQADVRTRNFPVRVRIKNQIDDGQPLIRAGMFARATLAVARTEKAILAPKDAIVLGGPSPVVFVAEAAAVKADDTAGAQKPIKVRPVPVQLGIASEGYIQVTGDLKPGESVVVQGNERLMPGQQVVIVREENGPAVKTAAAKLNDER
jgi:RND family efflux transporter MFP subunit